MVETRSPRHRRRTAHFRAPWGRTVKLTTGATVLVLVTLIVVPQLLLSGRPGPGWVRLLAPAVLLVGFGVVALFSVRGFTVRGRELRVHRLFWETRLPLHNFRQAHVDPGAMRGSWRTCGNGGLMAFTGWFRNKRLGSYRAFVTDPARCVVMEFKDRRVVVSPDDPPRFLSALGVEAGSNPNPR
jgi:hypothetical protein